MIGAVAKGMLAFPDVVQRQKRRAMTEGAIGRHI